MRNYGIACGDDFLYEKRPPYDERSYMYYEIRA